MASVNRMWTTFGVEPEALDYATMTIGGEPGYELRPESLESAYYLYRLTGEERYAPWAPRCGRPSIAGPGPTRGSPRWPTYGPERSDRMHSFLFAETLKYAYLLLAPPETLDLNAVVFNTEAHPLGVMR